MKRLATRDTIFIALRSTSEDPGIVTGTSRIQLFSKRDDASRMIIFLLSLPFMDPQRIGVIRLSIGGKVATIIGFEKQTRKIRRVILSCLCPLKKFLSNLKNGGYKYLNDSNGRNELYIVKRRNHRFTEKKYR